MPQRLDVGGVIGRVWRIYVDQAPVLMPAAAVVFVIEGIGAALLIRTGSAAAAVLAAVITIVAQVLFTGMVVELVADVQDGRRDSSPGQLLRAVTPVLGQLVLVGVLAAIAIFLGFALLVVPGLILITLWAVFVPVILVERAPGLSALGRSRELVRGNGWQVFGVLFFLYILVSIVILLADSAAESASSAAGIVVRVVLGVLAAPLNALAAAVLYFDLRAASGEGPASSPPPAADPPLAP